MTASANTNTTGTAATTLPPPPSVSNDTLRERILTGAGAGNVRGSLTRVASRYATFLHSLSSSTSTDDNNAATATAAAALQTELLLHDLEIRKLILTSRASDVNSSRYATTLTQMQTTLSSTQNEIDSLTTTLSNEKRIKQYREEYNALAKMGNEKSPPVRTTLKELQRVQREIEAVKSEVREAKWELNVRERQMRVFLASLGDLKCSLREEEMKREMKKRGSKESEGGVLSMAAAASSPEKGKKRKRISDGGGSDR